MAIEERKLYRRVKLMGTATKMTSTDYKERLQAEYTQLSIRIDGLTDSLKHYKETYTPLQLDLMEQQLNAMTNYKNVLELRARVENIELENYKAGTGK